MRPHLSSLTPIAHICCISLITSFVMGCGNNEDNNDSAGPPPLTCAEVNRTQTGKDLTFEAKTSLSGVYSVTGRQIYDSGEEVTIEPGTIFLMGPDAKLYFGWRNDPATVFARGTAERPILFCGTEARKGHWVDVELLGGTTSNSTLDHVRLEDGGKDGVATLRSDVNLRMRNIHVSHGAGVGMELSGLGADSADFTVTDHDGIALQLSGEQAINHVPVGAYTGNGDDVAEVSGFDSTNVVFKQLDVPYRQTDTRVVFGAPGGVDSSITFEAGVTYQFCQDCFMYIGWRGDTGKITAQGTAEAPVVFTSSRDTPMPGDWDGISLLTGTTSDSVIRHAVFEYGGKTDGAALIIQGGKGTVGDSTFRHGAGAGIKVEGELDAGMTIEGSNTYEDNAGGGLIEPS